jgi:tetratricopeptide (TPR) repeat protein
MRHSTGVFLLVLASAVALTASRRRPPDHRRTPEIQRIVTTANHHFSQGEYRRARDLYATGLSSVTSDNFFDRTSFLIGLAACDQMTQQYQTALDEYALAESFARQGGLSEHQIIIAANRAAVYRKMGYLAPALASLESVRKPLAIHTNPLFLTQAASLLRDIDFEKSVPLFRSAILNATMAAQMQAAAVAWLQLGHGYSVNGQLEQADRALTEAFRLRLADGKKQLQSCYFFLGYLRLRQGRPLEALNLLKRAKELANSEGAHTPLPWVYHQIARAHLQIGNDTEALKYFDLAVTTARALRMQLLPSDTFRTSAEANLQEIFSDYVRAGVHSYQRTHDPVIAARIFEVAEESRIAVFEHALNQSRELPPTYWELLARYQRELTKSLSRNSDEAEAKTAEIRLELSEMEARLGFETERPIFAHQIFENDGTRGPLQGVQTKLNGSVTQLSFRTARIVCVGCYQEFG